MVILPGTLSDSIPPQGHALATGAYNDCNGRGGPTLVTGARGDSNAYGNGEGCNVWGRTIVVVAT